MGTILSSNRDFNRALASQPRKSFGISKFEVPDNLHQHPLIGTLTIPVPVRKSQPTVMFNQPVEVDQTFIQPNISPVISEPSPPPIRRSSFSVQADLSTLTNPALHRDAGVIYRSVTNLNNHRLSRFRPNRSIIERNGKQFLTEMNERMERRHVQVFDERTGQTRVFEVTDYIPSRMVRAMRSHSQNAIPRKPLTRPSSFNNRSTLPAITYNPKEPSKSPSNLLDFHDLNNHDTAAREFDLYHRGDANISPSQPAGQYTSNSTYSKSQPQPYNNSTVTSQEVPSNYNTTEPRSYQPSSFRQHSPTASNYTASQSTVPSATSDDTEEADSDSEGFDQTIPSSSRHANVSYGTVAGQNSLAQIDPFQKIINPRDPYYKKRHGSHNYSEPIAKARGFAKGASSDYAPIPLSHRPSNSNQYSRRWESDGYET